MKQCRVKEYVKKAGGRFAGFVKRRKLLAAAVLLVIAVAGTAGVLFLKGGKKEGKGQQMETTAQIERMDLTNSISVTGTLKTAEGRTGSTTLQNIKVSEVLVEVGDAVQEGDVICRFDSADIEQALEDAKNNYQVNQQLDALENYETQYADTLENAEEELQNAKDTRDAYKNVYENAAADEETARVNLENVKAQYSLEALKAAYESAASDLKSALEKELQTSGGSASQILDLESYLSANTVIPESCSSSHSAYTSAKAAYEAAQKAVTEAQETYNKAKTETSSAYSAYEQAQSAREDAQDKYDDTVSTAEESYEKAKLQDQLVTEDDALNKIEDYEEQLEDCTVYASMSGTITELNVEEGNAFEGGTICEIQDVDNFIVEATVDEYDVVKIEEGQTAYIKTDSLGEEELEGEVTYVAPVGTSGQTMGSASGTASYAVEITIKEPQEKLRAGITASVSIALEESPDTLAVPYDCVQTNEKGESVIYVDDNGEKKEVIVETGIETDYYTEVKSDELSEGMTVYLSTPLLLNGETQWEATEESETQTQVMFDMGGGMPSGGAPGGMQGGAPGGF